MDKNAGLTPYDFFNFELKIYQNAGLTPCDFLNFCSKLIKKLDLPLVSFTIWAEIWWNVDLTHISYILQLPFFLNNQIMIS